MQPCLIITFHNIIKMAIIIYGSCTGPRTKHGFCILIAWWRHFCEISVYATVNNTDISLFFKQGVKQNYHWYPPGVNRMNRVAAGLQTFRAKKKWHGRQLAWSRNLPWTYIMYIAIQMLNIQSVYNPGVECHS